MRVVVAVVKGWALRAYGCGRRRLVVFVFVFVAVAGAGRLWGKKDGSEGGGTSAGAGRVCQRCVGRREARSGSVARVCCAPQGCQRNVGVGSRPAQRRSPMNEVKGEGEFCFGRLLPPHFLSFSFSFERRAAHLVEYWSL